MALGSNIGNRENRFRDFFLGEPCKCQRHPRHRHAWAPEEYAGLTSTSNRPHNSRRHASLNSPLLSPQSSLPCTPIRMARPRTHLSAIVGMCYSASEDPAQSVDCFQCCRSSPKARSRHSAHNLPRSRCGQDHLKDCSTSIHSSVGARPPQISDVDKGPQLLLEWLIQYRPIHRSDNAIGKSETWPT